MGNHHFFDYTNITIYCFVKISKAFQIEHKVKFAVLDTSVPAQRIILLQIMLNCI